MNLHTRAVNAFQLFLYTQRTDIKMRLFFNVGLSDCNAFMIICSWNVQNSLHPRFSSFFSPPTFPEILIFLSASHFSVLCLSSRSYRYPHSSFFLNHSFFIALSVPSILLPSPSTAFLSDVFLIPPRLSTLVIFSIVHHYTHSFLPSLFYVPWPPFLTSLSIFSPFYIMLNPHQHQSLFPLLTIFFSICNLSHFLESSISH